MLGSEPGAAPSVGAVGDLKRQGTDHPEGFPSLQSQKQVPCLIVSAADSVNHAETHRHRPTGIEAQQLVGGYRGRISLLKPETAQPDSSAMQKE